MPARLLWDHFQFLSTPSARRATICREHRYSAHQHFYPRPPRGGRPSMQAVQVLDAMLFLSTPSARRATGETEDQERAERISIHALREEGDLLTDDLRRGRSNFYPRPPRGGRLKGHLSSPDTCYFYPRPPRGGRLTQVASGWRASKFLSTPSARRATGCDLRSVCNQRYFYPRPPRGGRR